MGEYSVLSRRTASDSFNQSAKALQVNATTKLEQQLAEKQATIVELQQKVIQAEMKLNDSLTVKEQLQFDLSNFKDVCKTKIKHYDDKIEDLHMEIKQLNSKIEQLTKENQMKKEAMEQFKLICAEEKLLYSKELAQSEQKIVEIQLQHESAIRELKQNLENAKWESDKHQLEAEEAKNQLKIREKVISPCNHHTVIEQQRQVILEMENALFAQRSSFSQSQEAKLARIPQVCIYNIIE